MSTAEIPPEWNALVTHDLFLHTSYLKALGDAAPKSISLYYVGIFNADNLVGLAIIQRVELYAKDMFRSASASKTITILKNGLSKILKGNILVVGNLTQTGQHGIYFKSEGITQNEFIQTLFKAMDELKILIKNRDRKSIRAILFKDYFESDSIHSSSALLAHHEFYHFNVQPNMVLQILPAWHSMDDYLNDLNTKYKTRYKRAKKKLGDITLKELTLEEVLQYSAHLYQLYKNVSNNASFNTFVLPENHFYIYKLQLKDKFRVFAYYLNDEMTGFYSLILNNDILETYFLGYEQTHQYGHQLYLNMLYDMLSFGIENSFKTIVYARTAMEIKSSVGAKPIPMSMYIKHTNPLVNGRLNSIFKLMNPEQKWEQRNPFKNVQNS